MFLNCPQKVISIYSLTKSVCLLLLPCVLLTEKSINPCIKSVFLFSQLFISMVNWTSLMAQTVKNPPAMWEASVWSLGWEDCLEEDIGYPFQYSYLEIPMDRGAWWATQSMGLQRVRHDREIYTTMVDYTSHSFLWVLYAHVFWLFCCKNHKS